MFNNRQVRATGFAAPLFVLALVGMTIGQAAVGDTSGDKRYTRSVQSYQIPDVNLRDSHGDEVNLRRLLKADQRPVLLQFIFTSCQTVCPMLTAIMSQAQDGLREVDAHTRIISISIDPEHDTPERMRRYAEKYDAKGDWVFLTGDWDSIRKTLNAFDAMYEGGSKMYHKPYTFMRKDPNHPWVRLIGMMGANKLVGEYSSMLSQTTEAAPNAVASR